MATPPLNTAVRKRDGRNRESMSKRAGPSFPSLPGRISPVVELGRTRTDSSFRARPGAAFRRSLVSTLQLLQSLQQLRCGSLPLDEGYSGRFMDRATSTDRSRSVGADPRRGAPHLRRALEPGATARARAPVSSVSSVETASAGSAPPTRRSSSSCSRRRGLVRSSRPSTIGSTPP